MFKSIVRMFEDEENTVADNEEVIRRAADIKIKDVSWFNANCGPDFTYVKDLFTKNHSKQIKNTVK